VAGLSSILALSMTLAVGVFVVVVAGAYLVVHPAPQQIPLGPQHASHLEAALYVAGFFVVLPAAAMTGRRLSAAIVAGPNAEALPALAALMVGALAVSVLAARLIPGAGLQTTLASAALWCVAASASMLRARRAPTWRVLHSIAAYGTALNLAAGALVIIALLAFMSPRSISLVPLAIAAAAGIGTIVFYLRSPGQPSVSLPRGVRVAVDAAAVLLLLLVVPDIVIFGPPGVAGPPGVSAHELASLDLPIIAFHHDLFLGPVNQVLAGDAVLVKTASQYGVAPLYLLVGWFKLAPIGYGTFGLLDSVLTALCFAAAYGVLRILRTPRPLAWAAMALGVVVLAYNHPWSVGVFPQQGPLRFGLPMLLLLAAAVTARSPRRAGFAQVSQLLVIGLASIWSVETFGYCVVTLAALWCFEAFSDPARGGRWLRRQAGLAVGACIAAHLAFAGLTLAASGHLPDWTLYWDLVRDFLVGGMSKVSFDIPPWSPVVAIGAAYGLSALALVFVVRLRHSLLYAERGVLAVIAGTTAYGIAILYYYVDRSLSSVLPYICLPLLMVGALWLGLVLRSRSAIGLRARAGVLAFALGLSVLLASTAWSYVDKRFARSAAGHIVPGGPSVGDAMSRLWNPRALDPRAPSGERLLDTYMPGARRVYVLVPPDLATEILMRSGRANAFPFSDPWEETFVGSDRLPGLRDAVGQMKAGNRVLVLASALRIPPGSASAPVANAIDTPIEAGFSQKDLVPIQVSALQLLRQRFELRVLRPGSDGMLVVQLESPR
jgi:hypothetical protein